MNIVVYYLAVGISQNYVTKNDLLNVIKTFKERDVLFTQQLGSSHIVLPRTIR